jgi:inhibitor of KinA sporulation pathway (predicted exonuclease)
MINNLHEKMELLPQIYSHFLIVDVEATCSQNKEFPPHEMEIIEIGAAMVCSKTLKQIETFGEFIKPVRHPILTDFCIQKLSISQKDVDEADEFLIVMKRFQAWLYKFDYPLFCSWGSYDKEQFWTDCNYHNYGYPFASGHLNLKLGFGITQGIQKKQGMADALKLCGLELIGRHHRGIDDVQNMARMMPYIIPTP